MLRGGSSCEVSSQIPSDVTRPVNSDIGVSLNPEGPFVLLFWI